MYRYSLFYSYKVLTYQSIMDMMESLDTLDQSDTSGQDQDLDVSIKSEVSLDNG